MSTSSLKILCRYQYDPLDRLTGVGVLERTGTQRFYQQDHLTTELGEQAQRTIFRHQTRPLAQQQNIDGVTATTLLATDQAHSPLQTLGDTNPQQLAYTAYGHHPAESSLSRILGFNGECPDAITGHYLLGQGTRAFNPVLMRFNSPDVLSPFGDGGINSYAYCGGDPINFCDPTGNSPFMLALYRSWNFGLALDLTTPARKIASNPLKTINPTASTISRNSQTARNPTLNTMLTTPVSASAHQPRPSTSTLASQESQPTLGKTRVHSSRTTTPARRTELQRKEFKIAREYDEHVKNNANFEPVINSEQLKKWTDLNKELSELKPSATNKTLKNIRAKIQRIERQIKQDNVINHIRQNSSQ